MAFVSCHDCCWRRQTAIPRRCRQLTGEVFECSLLACSVILHLVSCDSVPNAADVRICFLFGNFTAWHTTQSPWNQAYTGSDPVRLRRPRSAASRSQSSWRTCSESSSLVFFCTISWTRPTVCRRVICWKSRTRRHDGLGRRHPQATHGRRAARNPAPAAGSRLLWADTK